MANSPYVATDIKQYMRKFQIEQTINQSINSLLKEKPEDPYSYLIGLMQKKSTPDIQINDLSMTESICGEAGVVTVKIKAKVVYFNQALEFYLNQQYGVTSEENNVFDTDRLDGKGMNQAIELFNNNIRPIIKQKAFKCSDQEQLDLELAKIYKAQEEKGLYIINSVSFAIQAIKSRVFYTPLYRLYSQLSQIPIKQENIPKFMVNCLQGGKAIGSKCKVFKYYLISNKKQGIPLIKQVIQNIRKTITSGKGGQASLKHSPDGTFVCSVDTILDNLKIVQEAINNANGKEHLSIGLSWAADTLYNPDTKKYELQNPKTPFDNDQMIDYIFKLLTDRPIIKYIEDPLTFLEPASWRKLITKVRETEALKSVKFGSRNGKLINVLAENFKESLQNLSIDVNQDTHPDLSAQERDAKNSQKFKLDFIQVRGFELKTVSNLIKVSRQLKKSQTCLILQDNCTETYNTELVDICFGLDCYCNIGNVMKFDRASKLKRALQIVQENEKNNEQVK